MNTTQNPTAALRETTAALAATARDVFYAGLGLVATAQEAAGDAFDVLVREGRQVDARRVEPKLDRAIVEVEQRAEKAVAEVRETRQEVSRKVEVQAKALEERLVETVAEVLRRLNVPTRDDVEALKRSIDRLNEKTAALRAA